ncbi:hypothetical protein, partial [Enterococcus casseliflavus]|uniref:hypothetical protein n=1 Tax=Enterococcus casseliflavus TaxID=37734 RepID=UPI003D0CF379
ADHPRRVSDRVSVADDDAAQGRTNPPTGDAGGGRWDHRALPVDADYRPYAGSHRTSGLPREPRTNERYRPCRLLRH